MHRSVYVSTLPEPCLLRLCQSHSLCPCTLSLLPEEAVLAVQVVWLGAGLVMSAWMLETQWVEEA